MMHLDQYYLLMSLLGYEMGLALIFGVRFTELLIEHMSPAYMSSDYMPAGPLT
jgi:hypothetical protein